MISGMGPVVAAALAATVLLPIKAAVLPIRHASLHEVANDTLLIHTPFILAHDAGSGYLDTKHNVVYKWTKTQHSPSGDYSQDGGLGAALECGARAFDARPMVQNGKLIWHHGSVAIDYSFAQSVEDTIQWLAGHPTELVLYMIWDCEGDGCSDAVDKALAARNVTTIPDCSALTTLTAAEAAARGRLASGGSLVAVTGTANSNGVACSQGNYDPSIACSGFGAATSTAESPQELSYGCWKSDSTRQKPIAQMNKYLDGVNGQGLPTQSFVQAQALWQESDDSVVLGTLRNSSLLVDELKSGLNAMVASEIAGGRWPNLRMVEVNNVCDGGNVLLAALRNRTL